MKGSHDWLPHSHADLYQQVVLTWNYVVAPGNRARMGFAADTSQGIWLDTVFTPAFNDYSSAYVGWISPADRTQVVIDRLERAEAAFTPLYRQLYTGMLRNSLVVTNTDLLEMGLPKRPSGERTPAPVATTYPSFSLDTSVIRCLTVDFRDQDSTSKAKPAGQHGAEIRWAVLDVAPVDISELTHSSFDTHTPFTLEFEGHDRGKTVYFALCWENTRGEKGKYSPIASAIIP